MSYRIIKRKHSLYKDQEEYVLQKEDYRAGAMNQINQNLISSYTGVFWTAVESFASLEAAKNKKRYLETGLNPGEEIVG